MYVLLLIIATIILGNIVSILEKSIYTKENLPSEDNILIYIMDETYEELNQNYVSGRNLKVDSNDYERIFPLSEIKELAKKSEIKNIYIRDESVYDKYYSVNEEENSDEKFIFSIPEVMYYNDTFINWMSIKEITYLKEGRLPNDNEFEIVVSEKILEEYDVERENAIGKNIQLDNVLYEIVGIGIEDVYLVSYEKGINRGIYCYNGNTFDEYYNKTKKYYNDMLYKGYLYDAIFIETEKGSEKEVLKELICNYPASNYYSHDFAYILNRGFNKTFYIAITVTTIVCSALYGASLSMILGGHLRNSVNKVNDYVNYYIDINIRNMYMRKYKYFIVMNYLINILVGIFYIRKKDIESIASVAIYLFIFIVQIPSVLVLMKNSNKLMERNINDC